MDLRRREHVLEMRPRSKQACARDVLGFRADEGTCARKGFMRMCRGNHSGRNTVRLGGKGVGPDCARRLVLEMRWGLFLAESMC